MKTLVLCLSAIVLFTAGCSKSSTTATGRDAFVGNYHMYDTAANSSNPAASNFGSHYNMSVVAVPATSDKVVFNNVGGFGASDTGVVSGLLVTFDGGNLNSADLTGSNLTLSTNYLYYNGYTYVKSTGTKY